MTNTTSPIKKEEEHGTLKEGEPHPAARSALEFVWPLVSTLVPRDKSRYSALLALFA